MHLGCPSPMPHVSASPVTCICLVSVSALCNSKPIPTLRGQKDLKCDQERGNLKPHTMGWLRPPSMDDGREFLGEGCDTCLGAQ